MRSFIKLTASICACIALVSCGGSGGSSSGGGGGGSPTIYATGVNIGNISTIPLGTNNTTTSVVVTNNLPNTVLLQSATYTTYSDSGAATPLPTTDTNSPANTGQCTSIQALGSCSVIINVPAGVTQGQYLLTMNYFDPTANKNYSTSQIISYSDQVADNQNGAKFSNINNTLFNQPGGSTTFSVPFVLTQDFTTLTAISDRNNPAFAPTISCPNNNYNAGNLCTLYVKVSNTGNSPVVSGDIIITSNSSSSQSLQKSMIKAPGKVVIKGVTGYVFNVPITVTQTTSGNLITSGVNVLINESTAGNTPQPITLLNNGNATITGITVTGATPITISSNTCTTLAANASCTFNVNVPLNTTPSGQSSVVVTYSNGASSGNTSGSLSFNVIYIAAVPGPALTMTAGQGSLNNTVVNTTQFFNVVVANTGNVALTSIAFNPNALPTNMTFDTTSTCKTDGTESLAVGTSCTLVVKYSPTATTSGTYTLREAANWVTQGGGTSTYTSATLAITYSAINGNAFVYITPNYVSYAIRSDGVDTATQTFLIINAGFISTTLESLVVTPSVTAFVTGGTCAVSTVLNQNESCTVTSTFGPTATTISTTAQLQAAYKPNPSMSTSTTFANLAFTSSPAALITVTNVVETGATGGAGTSGSPYTFVNSPATNPVQFTVTYSNSGTASATNFNVALNNLPVGYYVIESGSTCGHESTVTTLATSASCNVIFAAVNPSGLYNAYALSGVLNVNIPGYSYLDTNTGLNTSASPTFGGSNIQYVTASLLGGATQTAASWTTGTAGGSNNLVFTGATPLTTGTITVDTTGLTGTYTLSPNPCTISGGGVCTIGVTNIAGVPLNTPIYFNYTISPAGFPGTGIIGQGSFTYTN